MICLQAPIIRPVSLIDSIKENGRVLLPVLHAAACPFSVPPVVAANGRFSACHLRAPAHIFSWPKIGMNPLQPAAIRTTFFGSFNLPLQANFQAFSAFPDGLSLIYKTRN
jgi:hypothetical protein